MKESEECFLAQSAFLSTVAKERDTAVPSWKLRRGETDQVRKWPWISGDETMKGEWGGGGMARKVRKERGARKEGCWTKGIKWRWEKQRRKNKSVRGFTLKCLEHLFTCMMTNTSHQPITWRQHPKVNVTLLNICETYVTRFLLPHLVFNLKQTINVFVLVYRRKHLELCLSVSLL